MRSRKPLIIVGVLLALAAGWGLLQHNRQQRAFELSLECHRLAQRGEWSRLETAADELLQIAQDDAVGWYWKGESLRRRREFPEALDCLERVRLDDPRGIEAATVRMELIFHVRHEPLRALEIADALLDRDPALAEPRRHRIYFCAMTARRNPLRDEVREAIRYGVDLPLHYVYLMSSEDLSFRDAATVTQQWSREEPDSVLLRHASLMQQARTIRGEYLTDPTEERAAAWNAALQEIHDARVAHPSDTTLLEFLCLAAVDNEDVDAVEDYLQDAPATVGDDPEFLFYRGWYAARRGALAEADDVLQDAIRLNPLSVRARNERAAVLRRRQRLDEAARVQRLAATGAAIVDDIRRLENAQSADPDLLLRISEYAADCGDFPVSQAIYRRLHPEAVR